MTSNFRPKKADTIRSHNETNESSPKYPFLTIRFLIYIVIFFLLSQPPKSNALTIFAFKCNESGKNAYRLLDTGTTKLRKRTTEKGIQKGIQILIGEK